MSNPTITQQVESPDQKAKFVRPYIYAFSGKISIATYIVSGNGAAAISAAEVAALIPNIASGISFLKRYSDEVYISHDEPKVVDLGIEPSSRSPNYWTWLFAQSQKVTGYSELAEQICKKNHSDFTIIVLVTKFPLGANGRKGKVNSPHNYALQPVFVSANNSQNFDYVYAHEVCHLFGANDEYNGAPNITLDNVRNAKVNANSESYCSAHHISQLPCIMNRGQGFTDLCFSTRQAMGLDYWARPNSVNWPTEAICEISPAAIYTPDNGRLMIVTKPAGTTVLHYSLQGPGIPPIFIEIPGHPTSNYAPTLFEDSGIIHMIFVDTHNGIWHQTFDCVANIWLPYHCITHYQPIAYSDGTPSMFRDNNGDIYISFKQANQPDFLMCRWFTGTTYSVPKKVRGMKSNYGATFTIFNDEFYSIVKGVNDNRIRMYFGDFNNGIAKEIDITSSNQAMTNMRPVVFTWKKLLYCVYKSQSNNHLYYFTVDASCFVSQQRHITYMCGAESNYTPAIAVLNNAVQGHALATLIGKYSSQNYIYKMDYSTIMPPTRIVE